MLDFGDYGFELLFGVAWAPRKWALAGVAGWWLMFLAPLGRRKFTSRARIAATPEKIWNAYVLGPRRRTAGAGPGNPVARFLPGPPSRLRLEMRHRSGPKEFKSVVFDITAFEAPRLFEDQILSIDGVATEPGKAGRERLLLTPVGNRRKRASLSRFRCAACIICCTCAIFSRASWTGFAPIARIAPCPAPREDSAGKPTLPLAPSPCSARWPDGRR